MDKQDLIDTIDRKLQEYEWHAERASEAQDYEEEAYYKGKYAGLAWVYLLVKRLK